MAGTTFFAFDLRDLPCGDRHDHVGNDAAFIAQPVNIDSDLFHPHNLLSPVRAAELTLPFEPRHR